MDCEQAREEFAALLDGELEPEDRATVEAHLSQCSECLRELDGLKRVDTAYRRLPRVSAPDRFEEGVRSALRPSLFVRLNPGARVRRPRWPVVAAAAAVLLVAGAVAVRLGLSGPESLHLAQAPDTGEMAALEESAPLAQASRFAPKADVAALGVAEDAATAPQTMASRSADVSAEAPGAAPGAPQIMRFEGFAPATPPPSPAPEAELFFQAEPAPAPEAAPVEPFAGEAAPVESEPLLNPSAAAEIAPMRRMAAPDSERREVAGRLFHWADGAWRQEGFEEELVNPLLRESEAFQVLVAEDPRLAELESLPEAVIFRHGDVWYELPARDASESLEGPSELVEPDH